ncbi:hypothetical protein AMTRI_Chr09g36150 [Amborella trichopoda]
MGSSPIAVSDDLLGEVGEKEADAKGMGEAMASDDLIPGFGVSDPPENNRMTAETTCPQELNISSNKSVPNLLDDDPFVVLKSNPSLPYSSSSRLFTDNIGMPPNSPSNGVAFMMNFHFQVVKIEKIRAHCKQDNSPKAPLLKKSRSTNSLTSTGLLILIVLLEKDASTHLQVLMKLLPW